MKAPLRKTGIKICYGCGKMDARGELDSDHPASDRGIQQAHEGARSALGDCELEP